MLEHAQGWPLKHTGDSTGNAGAGVQTEAGEEGLHVDWEGQGWDEPSSNSPHKWDEEQGQRTRSGEQVCWEWKARYAGGHPLLGHGNQPGGSATDDLRDIFGDLTWDSIHGAGRHL